MEFHRSCRLSLLVFILFSVFFSDWVISKFLFSRSLILSSTWSTLLLLLSVAFFTSFINYSAPEFFLVLFLWFLIYLLNFSFYSCVVFLVPLNYISVFSHSSGHNSSPGGSGPDLHLCLFWYCYWWHCLPCGSSFHPLLSLRKMMWPFYIGGGSASFCPMMWSYSGPSLHGGLTTLPSEVRCGLALCLAIRLSAEQLPLLFVSIMACLRTVSDGAIYPQCQSLLSLILS